MSAFITNHDILLFTLFIYKKICMKTFKMFLISFVFASVSLSVSAQDKTETFKVSGECGMCQAKIEKAAKTAGASFASWDTETKELKVTYDAKATDKTKIQQAIANVGYDTPEYKATQAAYDKLHGCCKYERTASNTNATEGHSCCADKKCADAKCHKDGKCSKDMSCCKESGCAEKDCCKKS
jgi:periplasmic mercuric ion binding protein